MTPSFAEFQYFIEVAKSLNMSRAAERLCISQPSLSLAMKRLENTVGTPLLIRHQHGVALTQSGRQLLKHIKILIQYWEDIRTETLASSEEIQGSYTIGCHSTVAIDILSSVLPDLFKNNPKLEIHIKNDISRNILERIINFEIDIGILINPVKHPNIIIRKLYEDTMTLWEQSSDPALVDTHSNNAIVICDLELRQTTNLLNQSKKKGFHFDRIISVSSLEVIASMTANGCGIGILPTMMHQKVFPNMLKSVPDAPTYKEDICLVYRSELRDLPAIKSIIDNIKQYCSTLILCA